MGRPCKDLTGQQFGKLHVYKREGSRNGSALWLCTCDCGGYAWVTSRNLLSGHAKSCGHCSTDKKKHNMTGTRLYNTWKYIKSKKSEGISVYEPWEKAENFLFWAKENGYREGKRLRRKNLEEGFYPENCEWVYRSYEWRLKLAVEETYSGWGGLIDKE